MPERAHEGQVPTVAQPRRSLHHTVARCAIALSLACAPARPPRESATSGDAPRVLTSAEHAAASSSARAEPPEQPAREVPAPSATLPLSQASLTPLLEGDARFLVAGEQGRLGVLLAVEGALVPARYEGGRWERLPLPEKLRVRADDPVGIYFGRDNRPRLMGYRGKEATMVYLRYRDGRWQDQRSEVGALAGDAAHLYGVLGEADPEVVCRVGQLCLIKSRKGWQEVPPTIPADAVVRTFHMHGWVLTARELLRTGPIGRPKSSFDAVFDPAPWTTTPTGFWISAADDAVVVEPERGLLHERLASKGAWRSTPAPIAGPRDVVGPRERLVVVGDGGVARREGAAFARVGPADLRLSRAILSGERVIVAGSSGVFAIP